MLNPLDRRRSDSVVVGACFTNYRCREDSFVKSPLPRRGADTGMGATHASVPSVLVNLSYDTKLKDIQALHLGINGCPPKLLPIIRLSLLIWLVNQAKSEGWSGGKECAICSLFVVGQNLINKNTHGASSCFLFHPKGHRCEFGAWPQPVWENSQEGWSESVDRFREQSNGFQSFIAIGSFVLTTST